MVIMRLAKICKELNIGISTAYEFLISKGYSIDCNPNSKLSDEMRGVLLDKFYETDEMKAIKNAEKVYDLISKSLKKSNVKDIDKTLLDGVELDSDNKKFFQAIKLVKESDASVIYLTGKAGTGKTTFLKYLRQVYDGNVVVLAPTGVAAVNAHAQTIHSFFQLELTPYVPEDDRLKKIKYFSTKREIIKNMSLLIIDEVSMVRCDILDVIDKILRIHRTSSKNIPFGGVKVLLIGDLFQLPPVVTGDVWAILRQYYDSPYFFDSKVYSGISDDKKIYLELDKLYRQKEEEFIDILNKIRVNQLNEEDLVNLNKRSEIEPKGDCIILAAKNAEVDNYNNQKYNNLDGEEYTFMAQQTDIFPDSMKLVEAEIHLKVGAQVMLIKNKYDPQTKSLEYYNGSIGEILSIDMENESVEVNLVERGIERKVVVRPAEWENVEFVWDAELKESKTRVLGTYRQMPIRLAWAITINKSQGLTFENVFADLNSCFDVGQVYVALSRCRKLSGLYLKEPIRAGIIKIDSRVVDFSKTETPDTMVLKHLESGKADKKYQSCRMAFEDNDAMKMLLELDAAMKIRDDFQSDNFKKYIRVKLALYHRYKDKCLYLNEKIKKMVSDLQVAYEEIEISNREKKELLVEKSNLNNMMVTLQNRVQTLDQDFASARNEISALKREVNFWKELLEAQKSKVSRLENERTSLNVEIVRLGNITWWQKLFGKK